MRVAEGKREPVVASMPMSNGSFQSARQRVVIACGLLFGASGAIGCYDFRLTGPEDPAPVPAQLVEVSVEYRQAAGCDNDAARCDDPVVFFGSWMRAGGEFALRRDPTGYVWRGTALAVPANFPPAGEPYEVRIFDPHLARGQTGGYTGNRITIGRQLLSTLAFEGTTREAGLVFIDLNGEGHNPF